MKTGSEPVEIRDEVTKRTKIDEVGISTEPLLHFHLEDKPQMPDARSLPIRSKIFAVGRKTIVADTPALLAYTRAFFVEFRTFADR